MIVAHRNVGRVAPNEFLRRHVFGGQELTKKYVAPLDYIPSQKEVATTKVAATGS